MHVGTRSQFGILVFRTCLIGLVILLSLGACRKQKKSSDSLVSGDPLLASTTPEYSFGSAGPGSSKDGTLTITNSGQQASMNIQGGTLSYPFRYKDGVFPGTGGTCTTALLPGQTCNVVLTYAPSLSGTHRGTLTLIYTGLVSDTQISTDVATLGGNATNGAALNISDGTTYDYGNVVIGNSSEKTFTITNSGTLSASAIAAGSPNIAAPYAYKGGSGYPGTGGTCGSSLDVSGTCTIVIVFTPTASGTANDTIRIAYNDGLQDQSSTRAITGNGQSPASLGISDGATYDYGNVYQSLSSDKTFTVTNSGQATATSLTTGNPNIAAPYAYKGGSGYPGSGGTCGSSLAGSGTCTIVVTFSPTATGAANDTIRLSYNNGVSGGQSATRAITGTGVGYASLSISDGSTYSYGSKYINTTNTDKEFTVTNAYSGSATAITADALSAPFAFKGGDYPGTGGTCGVTVGGGASCTIVVRYSPTTLGSHSGTITLNYTRPDASSTTATRAMSGTGIGNPGDLDTTWGTSGRTSTTFGTGNERAYAMVLQSDGKSIVVGYSYNGSDNDFAMARYTTAGALDTDFGTSGKVTTDVSGNDVAYAVVIQSDGKIIVGGQSGPAGNTKFSLVRYSSAGALDSTFGAGGTLTTDITSADDWVTALAIDSNSKIVAAGTSLSLAGNYKFAVVRYGTDGSLDTTFDGDGKNAYEPVTESHNKAYAITILSNGKIILAGTSQSGTYQMSVMRITSAGSVDAAFGSSGYTLVDVSGSDDVTRSVKIDSSDNIVLGGGNGSVMQVVRLTSAGALDTNFDSDGIQTIDVGTGADDGNALAIDGSGNIIVAGFATNTDKDFGLARLSSSGSLDATFGTSGKVSTDYSQGPTNHNSIFAIALQSDGKIVAAGDYDTGANADFAIFRYWP